MAALFAHIEQLGAVLQQQRREAVPQIVETTLAQLGRDEQRRPHATAEVAVIEACACRSAGCLARFTSLPPLFFVFLLVMTVAYLTSVELVKHWFYRRYPVIVAVQLSLLWG